MFENQEEWRRRIKVDRLPWPLPPHEDLFSNDNFICENPRFRCNPKLKIRAIKAFERNYLMKIIHEILYYFKKHIWR